MTTEDARKLFVAGLPDSISEEVLRQLFQATGSTVLEVSLPKDRTSGRTRGFGFVTLETVEQAERSRSALDGSVQAGRAISVRPFQGAGGRRDTRAEGQSVTGSASNSAEDRTLYVGNLPYDAAAEEVEEVLIRCGVSPVLRVHLPIGPDGRPRGFGFVTLSSAEAVQQSLSALSNADLRGRRVMVKVAHPRGTAAPGSGVRTGAGTILRSAPRPAPGEGPTQSRFEAGRGETLGETNQHSPAQASVEFEEDEEGVRAAAGKSKEKKRKGVAAAAKRKGGVDDSRRRGGAASWQRWEDWDED